MQKTVLLLVSYNKQPEGSSASPDTPKWTSGSALFPHHVMIPFHQRQLRLLAIATLLKFLHLELVRGVPGSVRYCQIYERDFMSFSHPAIQQS
jgi:hypothetical protein